MAYVVIRRFRSGDGPGSARVFGEIGAARDLADTWYRDGWEVELIPDGRRGSRRMLPGPGRAYPAHQTEGGRVIQAGAE
ncbi:MAG: hypothetical protein ACR2MY_09385 [Candidatus Dormibacteria bacterium]